MPIVLVISVSLIVTLMFWLILPPQLYENENTDYIAFYEPVSRNILTGAGIEDIHGRVAIIYPPGYPIILAGIFKAAEFLHISEEVSLSVFTLLCMAAAAVFVFSVMQTVWDPTATLICSLIWVTYPLVLWFTKQPNSEIPFLVVFYAAFSLFWYSLVQQSTNWFNYFLSGLLIGIAMLIRPIAIGTGLVLAAILWYAAHWARPRSRLFLVSMVLLGNLLAVCPWEAWVYFKTGRVIPLSSNGAAALIDGFTFGINGREFRQGVHLPEDVRALMYKIQGRSGELTSSGDFVLLMKEELKSNPLAVAKLFIIKLARSWYATDSQRFETLIIFIQIPYLLLILWSSKLAWNEGGIQQTLVISVWLMILYFWAMTTVSSTIVRYMVPAMGLSFFLLPVLFQSGRRDPEMIKLKRI